MVFHPFLRGPAAGHELQEMDQRLVVTAALLGGELVGAFVELRGHFGTLVGRTAEGLKRLGELGRFHAVSKKADGRGRPPVREISAYATELRATIVTLSTC